MIAAWIYESRLTPDLERFLKTLTGNTEIEGSLDKLDKLTQEEVRMASAEQLKMTHSVDGKVMGVDDKVKGVDDRVKGVDDRVKGVEGKVQDVCDDVQDVRGDVQDVDHRVQSIGDNISSGVQGVDHKLDQVNRSLFFIICSSFREAQKASQATNLEIAFRDGYRLQVHPPIITTHAKHITPVQPNGFSEEVYSTNGNLPDLSCGYTENVRHSPSSPRANS